MHRTSPFTPWTVSWLLAMAFCCAGLAAAITLLNLGGRAIMAEGGFVATGGPYEIAHPAPGWVPLMPLSILSGFALGGWSLHLSRRTGGFSLLGAVWAALFISLGVQFGSMALHPPGGDGIAWGWMICAIVFIPMGVAGGLASRGLINAVDWPIAYGWPRQRARPYEDARYRIAYAMAVLCGAALGIWGAVALFARLAG